MCVLHLVCKPIYMFFFYFFSITIGTKSLACVIITSLMSDIMSYQTVRKLSSLELKALEYIDKICITYYAPYGKTLENLC